MRRAVATTSAPSARVEDQAVIVLGLDEPPAVVGGVLIAAHLLDVDRIPEPVHRFLLLNGLGSPHLICHGQMLTATAALR